jgi:hypothetical protein
MNRFWKPRRVRFAVAAAVAGAVGVLGSLGAVGYGAGLVGVSQSSPVAAQHPLSRVTICHHTHSQTNPFATITVSENAVPAHLGHGDTIGACQTVAATPAVKTARPPTEKQKPQHFARKHKAKKAKKAKKAHPATGPSKTTAQLDKAEVRSAGHARAGGQARTDAKERGQGEAHAYGHAKEHGSAKNQYRGQGPKPDHGEGNGNGAGNGGGSGNGHGKDH